MKTRKIVSSAAALFLVAAFFVSGVPATQAALSTNASADVVIGQQNMTSNSVNQGAEPPFLPTAQSLFLPRESTTAGNKLIVADYTNNRVLVYNSFPTSSNASADVVIGQSDMTNNSANQGGTASADTTLSNPAGVFYDGSKLFITDSGNNRVLIYNSIPTSNNAAADVVVGQLNMTGTSANQGVSAAENTLNQPNGAFSNGGKLFVSDWGNNRVLIYNSIPTSNNAVANVVIGQPDMTSNSANQGSSTIGPNMIFGPSYVISNGKKLFIADRDNNRVLIYNSVPTLNNASANVVIGQPDMASNSANQGESVTANTLYSPRIILPYGPKLLISDTNNNRVLIFNSIPTSNNASADIVIGQPDMTSNSNNQGGSPNANTLLFQRGVFVKTGKLIIADLSNNRVLIYNSFGSQWTITKNHSRTLSGDEKIKVQKKKLEFSGKKVAYKKGYVRIYRDGNYVKKVKIKNSGKWSTNFKDTGSAVKDFVIKYYNKSNVLQMNSETYTLGINRGSLVEATFEKMSLSGTENVATDNTAKNSGNRSKIEGVAEGM